MNNQHESEFFYYANIINEREKAFFILLIGQYNDNSKIQLNMFFHTL